MGAAGFKTYIEIENGEWRMENGEWRMENGEDEDPLKVD